MNMIFITNRQFPKITLPMINEQQAKPLFKDFLNNSYMFSLDYETDSLDPMSGTILLTSISDGQIVYVIDNGSIPLTNLIPTLEDKLTLAQSAKFEHKWSTTNGLRIGRVYCTMIGEQKLLSGSGLPSDLVSICKRRNVPIPKGMDKDIRKDFHTKKNLEYEDKHILYSGGDATPLFEIYKEQQDLIRRQGLYYYINILQMRLIPILANCELLGFKMDTKKWMQIYHRNVLKRANVENRLRNIVNSKIRLDDLVMVIPEWKRKLDSIDKKYKTYEKRIENYYDQLEQLKSQGKSHLKKYSDLKRMLDKCSLESGEQYRLKRVFEGTLPKVNWNSTSQVIEVLKLMNIPLPKAKSKTTRRWKPSISSAAREKWFIDHPRDKIGNVIYNLMTCVDEYKNLTHNIDTFGKSWLEKYIHPTTGKAHTFFKQGFTDTGRLSSGDAKNNFFNSQQIPAESEYRECFGTDTGYKVVTCDLNGAELVIMASQAQDTRLLELSKSDMHSHMANACWTAIYKYRKERYKDLTIKDTKGISYTLPLTVSKTENRQLRTDFKPQTFGTVYGMYAKKAGETIMISPMEGQITIDTIKKEIPRTFEMVESKVREAFSSGKVVHNTRTNSRRWFLSAYYALTDDFQGELSFKQRSEIDGAARNTSIQGTQADMIIESIVLIDRFIKKYKIDAALMGTVHDEVIYRYREDLDWFPELVKKAMVRTANKYLENVMMNADYEIGLTWKKGE